MFIFITVALVAACMDNARRAAAKGYNPTKWSLLTFFSFLTAVFVTCFILAVIVMFKYPQLIELAQTNDREAMSRFMERDIAQHQMLYATFIIAGSFGGYLLIRYLIDRKGNSL